MAKLTPMMEQYFEIKEKYEDCILFFRLGDFYEMFFDDALVASKELEITLTGRDCGQEERAPMCGVPFHAADGYILKLVEKGYKVAICEQVENPKESQKESKGIVKRDVVRVVTPGTLLDTNGLNEGQNNYILTAFQDEKGLGIACADVSTGEFFTTSFDSSDEQAALDEIFRISPKEIICNEKFFAVSEVQAVISVKPTVLSSVYFIFERAESRICKQFGVANLNGLGLVGKFHMIVACGALLEYLKETQKNALSHIFSVKIDEKSKFMIIDQVARRNLELVENTRDKSKKFTLLSVLDKTKTAMGARLLRHFVLKPLISKLEIDRRLEAVSDFKNSALAREETKEMLSYIYDFERIVGRIIYGSANPKDLVNLKNSFKYFPQIKAILAQLDAPLFKEMVENFDTLVDVYDFLESALKEECPVSVRDGGFIKDGYNEELDKHRLAKTDGTTWLLEMETAEKERTGIKNLKIRYNKIFGYYIEITNSNKDSAPPEYVRRQTLANCERFTTPMLKDIEDAILGADERIGSLEFKLFTEIIAHVVAAVPRISLSAQVVAAIDVLQSLATVAEKNNYVCPTINEDGILDIKDGRHPVIEEAISQDFIPNDAFLDKDANLVSIITGPNMAGKSTFMRQSALINIMAQIGSFIPASSGNIGVVDRVFTRVGASDDLSSGQSTFMVEMSEVANIINNATPESLIILDEIGRGTSTFDGLSIAWSVVEYISGKIGAKTLFATHYHELTELEGKIHGINNYTVLVKESGADVVFMRKIVRGGSDNSYGIHVAKIAGLPSAIIDRAYCVLDALNSADIAKNNSTKGENIRKFAQYGDGRKKEKRGHRIVIEELEVLDVSSLTPFEAISKLFELKQRIEE